MVARRQHGSACLLGSRPPPRPVHTLSYRRAKPDFTRLKCAGSKFHPAQTLSPPKSYTRVAIPRPFLKGIAATYQPCASRYSLKAVYVPISTPVSQLSIKSTASAWSEGSSSLNVGSATVHNKKCQPIYTGTRVGSVLLTFGPDVKQHSV